MNLYVFNKQRKESVFANLPLARRKGPVYPSALCCQHVVR